MAEQFQVPQFIEREPRLIGPFTVKQAVTLGVGGIIIAALWFSLEKFLFFPAAFVVGGIAASLTFVKINGKPLLEFITSFFSYFASPQLYIWQKNKSGTTIKEKFIKSNPAAPLPGKSEKNEALTKQQIEDIAKRFNK